MNQIPNIEEVGAFPNDPTGLRREFAIMFHRGDFIKDGKDNSELISDWFHHQLQKARQDWKMASVEPVAKAIYNQMSYTEDGVKPEWVERGNSFKQDEARQLALKALDHSELDQDNKYKIN